MKKGIVYLSLFLLVFFLTGISAEAKADSKKPAFLELAYTPGTDITDQLEADLNAAAHDPDAVVELPSGTFIISRPIAVVDFIGTFKGQGKTATVLRTPPTLFPLTQPPLPPYSEMLTFLLQEHGGTASEAPTTTISDMTIEVVGPGQGIPAYNPDGTPYILPDGRHYRYGGWKVVTPLAIGGRYVYDSSYVGDPDRSDVVYWRGTDSFWNINLENLGVVPHRAENEWGESGTVHDSIVVQGAITEGRIFTDKGIDWFATPSYHSVTGDILFRECDIDPAEFDSFDNGFMTIYVVDSEVRYIDCSARDNWGNSLFIRTTNSNVEVRGLKTSNCSGPYLGSNHGSTVLIHHSNIHQAPGALFAGVEVWGDPTLNLIISKNKIHGEDSWLWGPIFIEGVLSTLISNNKITGKGPTAIYLGVYNWYPGSVTLMGNNLAKWETTFNPWGVPSAPIWLGPYITDSTVVGGNNKVNVYDEPEYDYSYPDWWNHPLPPDANGNAQTYDANGNTVPKNNVFTGVNNMHLNVGQDVRAAMKQKVEAKKAMMSRDGR